MTNIITPEGSKIITIDYSLTFKEMLEKADIPVHQIGIILNQLGDVVVSFPHKSKVTFEVHDFTFGEFTTVKSAEKYIRSHNPESKWKPFHVEHLMFYWKFYPSDPIFRKNLFFASGQRFKIGGVDHVFMFELNTKNSSPQLELIPDDHAWAAGLSVFPGQRKIKIDPKAK